MILTELYLIAATMALAWKDATSYSLMDKNTVGSEQDKRRKKWHLSGLALYGVFILPFIFTTSSWLLLPAALLIRLGLYDLAFNKLAGLDYNYIGETAVSDKIFRKIFGEKGATKKSLVFLILLVILNFLG